MYKTRKIDDAHTKFLKLENCTGDRSRVGGAGRGARGGSPTKLFSLKRQARRPRCRPKSRSDVAAGRKKYDGRPPARAFLPRKEHGRFSLARP
ncbi:hypothetical protein EVAR_33314_1 [Eumeta japonica]|uniref:Uncharacterized protein n=1 Tax=Eumeta variegata TaxID=151549 RepID=A0A4C1WFS4_EUMVA|nr:hypothetical protein EVAR_33314_1 [Eumeta japonica]